MSCHASAVSFSNLRQVWLFVGVLLILGSGNKWHIPLIASLIFTAVVIIVPAVYEYALNEHQRHALSKFSLKLLPGNSKARSSWLDLPAAGAAADTDGLIVDKDVDSAQDSSLQLPRHRHSGS